MTRHTDEEIARAAERFEVLADALDPDVVEAERLDDLRTVAAASQQVRATEAGLLRAVEVARDKGRSWNQIAVALGVTRQAARQRYSGRIADTVTKSGRSVQPVTKRAVT